jgi:hypothetical protein
VSFGGSSLIMTMMQVGILLNISRYARHDARAVVRHRRIERPAARAWGMP